MAKEHDAGVKPSHRVCRRGAETARAMNQGSQQLEIRLREGENCALLSLHGELDVASAGAFMEQLSLVNRSGVAELTVDLSELSYIDPTGLSLLAVEQQRAVASGMTLHIASPSDFVRRMLRITGLIDVLDVLPVGDDGSDTGLSKSKGMNTSGVSPGMTGVRITDRPPSSGPPDTP
jgi:anti-anti-sigma factor